MQNMKRAMSKSGPKGSMGEKVKREAEMKSLMSHDYKETRKHVLDNNS